MSDYQNYASNFHGSIELFTDATLKVINKYNEKINHSINDEFGSIYQAEMSNYEANLQTRIDNLNKILEEQGITEKVRKESIKKKEHFEEMLSLNREAKERNEWAVHQAREELEKFEQAYQQDGMIENHFGHIEYSRENGYYGVEGRNASLEKLREKVKKLEQNPASEVKFAFQTRKELLRFANDMDKQGIFGVAIDMKVNDQWIFATNHSFVEKIQEYAAQQDILLNQYQEYQKEKVNTYRKDISDGFMTPMEYSLYETEAGKSQQKLKESMNTLLKLAEEKPLSSMELRNRSRNKLNEDIDKIKELNPKIEVKADELLEGNIRNQLKKQFSPEVLDFDKVFPKDVKLSEMTNAKLAYTLQHVLTNSKDVKTILDEDGVKAFRAKAVSDSRKEARQEVFAEEILRQESERTGEKQDLNIQIQNKKQEIYSEEIHLAFDAKKKEKAEFLLKERLPNNLAKECFGKKESRELQDLLKDVQVSALSGAALMDILSEKQPALLEEMKLHLVCEYTKSHGDIHTEILTEEFIPALVIGQIDACIKNTKAEAEKAAKHTLFHETVSREYQSDMTKYLIVKFAEDKEQLQTAINKLSSTDLQDESVIGKVLASYGINIRNAPDKEFLQAKWMEIEERIENQFLTTNELDEINSIVQGKAKKEVLKEICKNGQVFQSDSLGMSEHRDGRQIGSFRKTETDIMFQVVSEKYGIDFLSLDKKERNQKFIEIKKEILKNYEQWVPLDKHLNIDTETLKEVDLRITQWAGKDGTMMTQEELDFLIATSRTNMPPSIFDSWKLQKIGQEIAKTEDYSWVNDAMNLKKRTEQIYKGSKTIKCATVDTLKKIAEQKTIARKTKNNDIILDRKEEKPTATLSKKPKNNRIFKPSRKQEKRRKRLERKEKKAEYFHKTFLGKALHKKRALEEEAKKKFVESLIGRTMNGFNFIKRKVYLGVAAVLGGMMLLVVLISVINGVLTTISSFFGISGNSVPVEDTVIYQLYETLQEEEDDWLNGYDTNKLFHLKNSLSYGVDRLPLNDYVNHYVSKAVCEMESSDYTIKMNPFDFTPKDSSAFKTVTKYDYLNRTLTPMGDSVNTSNIKEILSMMDVMFKFETADWTDQNVCSLTGTRNEMDWDNFWTEVGNGVSVAVTNVFKLFGVKKTADVEISTSYNQLLLYVTNLFTSTHDVQLDMAVNIYPLIGSGTEKICPECGCMSYNGFRYFFQDSENVVAGLEDDKGIMHQIDTAYVKVTDNACISETVTPNSTSFQHAVNSDCWTLTTDTVSEDTYEIKPELTSLSSGDSRKIINIQYNAASDYYYYTFRDMNGGFTKSKIWFWVNKGTDENPNWIKTSSKDDISSTYHLEVAALTWPSTGARYTYDSSSHAITKEWYDYSSAKLKEYTDTIGNKYYSFDEAVKHIQTYTWSCQGHEGTYCGGHITMYADAQIYSFSDAQIGEGGSFDEKVRSGHTTLSEARSAGLNIWVKDNIWVDDYVNAEGVNQSALKNAKDIFDVDMLIKYGLAEFPCKTIKDYEGWTYDNMSLAILKYKSDWYDLYGLDVGENVGVRQLSATDIDNLSKAIYQSYGSLSEKKQKAVIAALQAVGRGNYDTSHRWHTYLTNRCAGKTCYKTDDVGFGMYIMNMQGLPSGITSTVGTTINKLLENSIPLNRWSDAKPGDILLIYVSGGWHCMVYLGEISSDITLSSGEKIVKNTPITIDCSQSKNGISSNFCGNIYLRCGEYTTAAQYSLTYIRYIPVDN